MQLPNPTESFENKIVLNLCLALAVITFFSTIINILLGLSIYISGLTITASVSCILFYFAGKKYRAFLPIKTLLSIELLALMNVGWYINFASKGPMLGMFSILIIFYIFVWDNKTGLALSGITFVNVLGMLWFEFNHPKYFPSYPTVDARVLDAYQGAVIGIIMALSLSYFTKSSYLKIQQDLRMAKEEAEKRDNLKSAFLANISHEIRTPLHAIVAYSELVEESTKHLIDEDKKEFFERIRTGSKRLIKTVHEILDASQIELGNYKLMIEQLDLALILTEIMPEYQSMANEKGLEFTFSSEAAIAPILGDRFGISYAINNIIDNAIKYTECGKVAVSIHKVSNKFKLRVQDTGIGISEEYRKILFEPFSQESSGFTKKYQGIGLGLAVTKGHLDLNHVGIEVESAKGVGTKIVLTFKAEQ